MSLGKPMRIKNRSSEPHDEQYYTISSIDFNVLRCEPILPLRIFRNLRTLNRHINATRDF